MESPENNQGNNPSTPDTQENRLSDNHVENVTSSAINEIEENTVLPTNQPVYTNQAPTLPIQTTPTAEVKTNTSIGVMILQWLTYAFWGWTVLSLSALTASVIAHLIAGEDTGSFTPYGIAATLTLMPIAFVCEFFYTKKEPKVKKGAEVAIAIIHAVIFALFGVGSLIVAVFSLVSMYTNSENMKSSQVALISSLIIAFYYGLTFIRALDIKKIPWYKKVFGVTMAIFVLITVVASILGPVSKERRLRTDRLIENNLSSLSYTITDYVIENDKLPERLSDLNLKENTKKLVDQNLVTYKKEGLSSSNTLNSITTSYSYSSSYYKYQLCVVYEFEKKDQYSYNSSYGNGNKDEYSTSINAYSHPEGEVCYKLKVRVY